MDHYSGQELDGAMAAEKYDGVCGRWDGTLMRTRAGNPIRLPAWFCESLPRARLEGELWAGRGQFEKVSALINMADAPDEAWRVIRYLVWDAPGRVFLGPCAEAVRQVPIESAEQLDHVLQETVRRGGEGVVITLQSGEKVKHKPLSTDDGEVIGYAEGKGRNAGLTGALKLRLSDGQSIKLGMGLDDDLRRHPPAVGSIVEFAFEGLTNHGKPRFARFLRVRAEKSLDFAAA